MNLRLYPTSLAGTVPAVPAKSMAHRLLICGALADAPTRILCGGTSADIEATVSCLRALGADIQRTPDGFLVSPGVGQPEHTLYCGESGSTLRFLLPVAAALGHQSLFHLEGRLGQRPLSPLQEELSAHGVSISVSGKNQLLLTGQLHPGCYTLPGNVSSQFISGLLLALPLLNGVSQLSVTGTMESAPYVRMTLAALRAFGVPVCQEKNCFAIYPSPYCSPGIVSVEGDWSNAAFWYGANALGSRIAVTGLNHDSIQGDRAILSCLSLLGKGLPVDVSQIPDLFPILAVVATGAENETSFVGVARLRLKESDRILSVTNLIRSLGGTIKENAEALTVYPAKLQGGVIHSCNDHRIAMAAAVAATCCRESVTILAAEATAKSYPGFWADYAALGGKIEEV